MLKLDGMQNIDDDKFFELWTKKLEEELPNFWNNLLKSHEY